MVRTDRRRLTPLTRSTPATLALRTTVRPAATWSSTGRRRQPAPAHLQSVFPAVVCLFAALDSAISLSFLERFPTQAKADWLTTQRLAGWLAKVGYCGRVDPAVLHQRVLDAPRGRTVPDTYIHAATTAAFVAVLRTLRIQIAALEVSISYQLNVHPERSRGDAADQVEQRTGPVDESVGPGRDQFSARAVAPGDADREQSARLTAGDVGVAVAHHHHRRRVGPAEEFEGMGDRLGLGRPPIVGAVDGREVVGQAVGVEDVLGGLGPLGRRGAEDEGPTQGVSSRSTMPGYAAASCMPSAR